MNFMDIGMHGTKITIIFMIWGFRSVVGKKHSVLEYDAVLTDNLLTNFQRFFFPPHFKVDKEEVTFSLRLN